MLHLLVFWPPRLAPYLQQVAVIGFYSWQLPILNVALQEGYIIISVNVDDPLTISSNLFLSHFLLLAPSPLACSLYPLEVASFTNIQSPHPGHPKMAWLIFWNLFHGSAMISCNGRQLSSSAPIMSFASDSILWLLSAVNVALLDRQANWGDEHLTIISKGILKWIFIHLCNYQLTNRGGAAMGE